MTPVFKTFLNTLEEGVDPEAKKDIIKAAKKLIETKDEYYIFKIIYVTMKVEKNEFYDKVISTPKQMNIKIFAKELSERVLDEINEEEGYQPTYAHKLVRNWPKIYKDLLLNQIQDEEQDIDNALCFEALSILVKTTKHK